VDRYAIALGKKEIKRISKTVLDRITKNIDGMLSVNDRAAICLIIAEKIFPKSEDVSVDVATDLMYMPDFIIARIVQRIIKI
jgi:hypothetical protein